MAHGGPFELSITRATDWVSQNECGSARGARRGDFLAVLGPRHDWSVRPVNKNRPNACIHFFFDGDRGRRALALESASRASARARTRDCERSPPGPPEHRRTTRFHGCRHAVFVEGFGLRVRSLLGRSPMRGSAGCLFSWLARASAAFAMFANWRVGMLRTCMRCARGLPIRGSPELTQKGPGE